jgi:hypothetical protein
MGRKGFEEEGFEEEGFEALRVAAGEALEAVSKPPGTVPLRLAPPLPSRF